MQAWGGRARRPEWQEWNLVSRGAGLWSQRPREIRAQPDLTGGGSAQGKLSTSRIISMSLF